MIDLRPRLRPISDKSKRIEASPSYRSLPCTAASIDGLSRWLGCDVMFLKSVVRSPDLHYASYQLPNAVGSPREVRQPSPQLMAIQKTVHRAIKKVIRWPDFVHGGVPRRGISSNATPHVARAWVAIIDIEKFYAHVSERHVGRVLQGLGFRRDAIRTMTRLLTYQNQLPIGSPTSPILGNLALLPLDRDLRRLIRSLGLSYTRYVDDITISGDRDFRHLNGKIVHIIGEHGFRLGERISFLHQGRPQVVTGLTVNCQLRPAGTYIQRVKHSIRALIRGEYAQTAHTFAVSRSGLRSTLNGKIAYIANYDADAAHHLKRLMYAVDWRRCADVLTGN